MISLGHGLPLSDDAFGWLARWPIEPGTWIALGAASWAYVAAACAFWWPVAGLDPGAQKLRWPVRLAYLSLALPQQTFLGLAIYSSDEVLYDHYAAAARASGLTAIDDQRVAAIVMWLGGDALFLVALVLCLFRWMRYDEREAQRLDRRLA